MLKKLGITLAIAIGLVIAVVSTRPDTFKVERSATIDAPADVVYGLVADFHGWAAWSPWDAMDPAMSKTYVTARPSTPSAARFASADCVTPGGRGDGSG